MTKQNSDSRNERQNPLDKNLQNVEADLQQSPVNSHQAQQLQQATNDRRHQDALNHEGDINDDVQ